ncbi:hypothetical protein HDV00_007101 [Rhizophlyctis rosea]|nr:hypothetical protein HDV00_007101 [Rhizophlyctis rosea]
MDVPVAYLRRANTSGVPFILQKDNGTTLTTDPTEATHVSFPDPADPTNPAKFKTFSFKEQSGYRDLPLSSLVVFFLNKDIAHSEYLKKCAEIEGAGPVSMLHRKDVLEYLGGGTSVHVKGSDARGESAKRGLDDFEEAGREGKRQRLILDEKELEAVKTIRSQERTIRTLNNVLNLRSNTKLPDIRLAEKHLRIVLTHDRIHGEKLGIHGNKRVIILSRRIPYIHHIRLAHLILLIRLAKVNHDQHHGVQV